MRAPPRLKRGDRVALVAPSSPLAAAEPVEAIAAAVERLGFSVQIGDSCRGETACGYAAAPAAVKAADINAFFADPAIRAIWCVRGGSTAWQVLPLLDYGRICRCPKAFLGFSDVTALHTAIRQRCGFITYHSPTANRALAWEEGDFSWKSLRAALEMEGCLPVENPPGEPIRRLRPGRARGELTGGNLSLIAASMGTPWQLDARGRILFLEDVGEDVYAVHRMLSQLRFAGVLDRAAGLVFGPFAACRNTYRADYGVEELLRDFFAAYPKPVLGNVASAHVTPMVTLPLGAMCTVDGDCGTMMLEQF